MTSTATPDAEQLRNQLADYIRGRGTFHTPEVETAFRTVPRHLFLPGVDLATAYAPKPVVTKRASDGTALSSASSPNLVADMLEQLAVSPGDRILEIGAATGINAALLSELSGPTGHIVTIEYDADLTAGARSSLTNAGYDAVHVIHGDGAVGDPAHAPYNKIIVTAGAWDITKHWWQQLAPNSRLVVPLRLHGSGLTRCIAFDLTAPGHLTSASALVCGFVPMRGATEHDETHIQLTDDIVFHIDTDDSTDTVDPVALRYAINTPAHNRPTGIVLHDNDPVEHLDLWLLTTGQHNFGRLSTGKLARETGRANPALRWAGASIYNTNSLAYLTLDETSDNTSELGITAHGPSSERLATELDDRLHHWHQEKPAQPLITARTTPNTETAPNKLTRPNTAITIDW
ncbi:MAG: methyltransferase, FxLD system [Actinophytocola sp.]|uniref:methyltransferase, FxLD system n=1 Tax=Actinophytocola sp. TaxID=1872138 RepID=UPI003C77E766